jgi:hypothetical protein
LTGGPETKAVIANAVKQHLGDSAIAVGQRLAFDTRLTIFDILGRELITLVNQQLSPGTYETEFDGSKLASGMYFYSLQAGDPSVDGQVYKETKKMVLIK